MNARPASTSRPRPVRPDAHLSSLAWLTVAAGATALWIRHAARRAEALHPPRGRFLELEGVRLHYLERGTGPTVVLLHGNGAMATDFEGCGLMDALAANHRVIAFDRPGFGYSDRPGPGVWPADRQAALLLDACQALDAPDPVVVGHSWGALVAIAMGLEPGKRVRGLVLVSGYFYPTLRVDILQGVPRLPLIGDVLRYTVSPLVARLTLPAQTRLIFAPQPVAPAFLAAVPPSLMLRPWHLRAAAEESGITPAAAARLAPRYAELQLPVEIFAGRDDRYAAQDGQSVRLHQELPHSTLHLLSGEGHMLHYRIASAIAQAAQRMAQTGPQAASGAASQPEPGVVGV